MIYLMLYSCHERKVSSLIIVLDKLDNVELNLSANKYTEHLLEHLSELSRIKTPDLGSPQYKYILSLTPGMKCRELEI
jgi:hypothetical protein